MSPRPMILAVLASLLQVSVACQDGDLDARRNRVIKAYAEYLENVDAEDKRPDTVMHREVLGALRRTPAADLRRGPVVAFAMSTEVEGRDHVNLVVYWLQDRPDVDAVRLRCGDKTLVCRVPSDDKKLALERAKERADYHVYFKFDPGTEEWKFMKAVREGDKVHVAFLRKDKVVSNELPALAFPKQ